MRVNVYMFEMRNALILQFLEESTYPARDGLFPKHRKVEGAYRYDNGCSTESRHLHRCNAAYVKYYVCLSVLFMQPEKISSCPKNSPSTEVLTYVRTPHWFCFYLHPIQPLIFVIIVR